MGRHSKTPREDSDGLRLGRSEGEPGLWEAIYCKETLYFAFSHKRRDALLAAESRLASLTKQRDDLRAAIKECRALLDRVFLTSTENELSTPQRIALLSRLDALLREGA